MPFEPELPSHISEPPAQGVLAIPYQRLSDDALHSIIEEFVSREGTDYGDYDYSFADKKAQVLTQLQQGTAVILFDPSLENCHIELKANLSNDLKI